MLAWTLPLHCWTVAHMFFVQKFPASGPMDSESQLRRGATDPGEPHRFLINCDWGGSLQNRVLNIPFEHTLTLFNFVKFVEHTLALLNSVKFTGHLRRFSILYG